MAAMVNMNSLLSGKDSRWLQLEVCREFQRNKCTRQDTECKFAHPPANVEVQNGKVTACYDSIKGRCNRDKPPCKYFHPPQHLKDQLLINGRNHLALKNALIQQMGGMAPGQPVIPGQVQTVATNPYLTGIPTNTYSPFYAPGHLVPALLGPDPTAVASQLGPVVPQAVQVAQQKIPRSDRLEVCREFLRGACKRAESDCRFAHPQDSVARHEDGSITVCMDAVKGRCARDPCRYFHPPLHLQAQLKAAQSRATAAVAAAAATAPVSVSAAAAAAAAAAMSQRQQHQQMQQQHSNSQYHNSQNVAALVAAHHHQQQQQQQQLHSPGSQSSSTGGGSNALSLGPQHSALEVGKKRAAENDIFQLMDVKTVGSFYYENFAFSGVVPYKRPAAEKSGIPVYQPGATTYQQLMQLQQPFVPVSYDKVEVIDQRVAVCRDHANGQCRRKQCKYYHIPIVLPPANVMAALISNNNNNNAMHNNNNSNTLNNNNNSLTQNMNNQQPQQQQIVATNYETTHNKAILHATPTTNYNNNLIIIEPALQQHQQQPQQHHQIHYTTPYNSNLPRNTIATSTTATLYQTQQHYQTNPTITYHCHSPYSPSSASSSSSCSIATSPTTLCSTIPTTSTVTIPTAISSNYATLQPTQATTFLKTTSLLPQTYYDISTAGVTPTIVLSSDYNSNCIPILTTPTAAAAAVAAANVSNSATSFIYPATTAPPPTFAANNQHIIKYSQQHFQQYQPQTVVATTKSNQYHQQQQHHHQQQHQHHQQQHQQQHNHYHYQHPQFISAVSTTTANTASSSLSASSSSSTPSTTSSTGCSN